MVFADALNAAVPLPVPLAPDVTVSHAALLTEPHAHDASDAVIVVDALPPAAATV